jgi:hypothetical protein
MTLTHGNSIAILEIRWGTLLTITRDDTIDMDQGGCISLGRSYSSILNYPGYGRISSIGQ